MSLRFVVRQDQPYLQCGECGTSVYNCELEGVRVPIPVKVWVGELTGTMYTHCWCCGGSIYAKPGDLFGQGQARPWIVYVITGQIPNSGDPVDLLAVRVPPLLREIMQLDVARLQLCLGCALEVLGTRNVEVLRAIREAGGQRTYCVSCFGRAFRIRPTKPRRR